MNIGQNFEKNGTTADRPRQKSTENDIEYSDLEQ